MVSDQFGESVSISGDTAVVGAWLEDNDRGLNAGSAYGYRWSGEEWIQTTKLLAPDFFFNDQVYLHSGEPVILPPGTYDVTYGRGPEYRVLRKKITVPEGCSEPHKESFKHER